jgi:sugar O-acyltransferase (sialic acid O-acetyltransferase NeuD family)
MKKLIIIGARGYGREIFGIAQDSGFEVKGFLDDKSEALDVFYGYPSIISSVENYTIENEDFFICALGDVKYKKKYIDIIIKKGGIFTNVIHPTSTINRNVKLGFGIIICPFVYVGCDTEIGNFVTIQANSSIGHDVKIGDYSQINSQSFIGGFSTLGEQVTMYPCSSVVPKKRVGNCSNIGINSSLLGNIPDNTTIFGNPGKKIN